MENKKEYTINVSRETLEGVVMIDRKKMTTLLINVISVKMFLTFPKVMIINSGNAAWIECIYNTLIVIRLFWITTKLYRSNKNIIQLAEMTGKKWLKIIVGVVVFVVLLINYSSIIRIFPETVKIVLLQDFKIEFIIPIFMLAIGIGAYIGLEPIARVNNMFMPLAGIVLLLSLILFIPYFNINNIFPILGNGVYSIMVKGINTISLFSDILLLNILLPYCENSSEAKKSGWRAIYISATIGVVILLSYCLIYPYPVSREFMIPVYQLSRVIHLGNFFSRFEVIFQFVWSILVLIYSSIYVYALCYVWQITFDLKYYKPLILPVVIISGIVAVLPSSVVDLVKSERLENIIVYPVAFLLPILFGFYSKKIYNKRTVNEESGESE